MPTRNSIGQHRRETLAFWLIILLICAIAGVLSYQAGRNWVGQRLAEVDLHEERGVSLGVEESGTQTVPVTDEGEAEAPLQPVVEVEERAPTEGEQAEMKLREAEKRADEYGPQDGAELHAAEDDERADSDESSAPASGEWVVTAGSFAQAENANRQADGLRAKGYTPLITEITIEGRTFHRVNAGTFETRAEAEALVQKLRDDDFVAGLIHR